MNLGVRMTAFRAVAIGVIAAAGTRSRRPEDRQAASDTGPRLPVLPEDRRPLVSRPTVSSLSSFSTAQLCWMWRISGVRLRGRIARGEAQRLARMRERCLIELHRRDPEAFRRWIRTARAADDPAAFFRSRREPRVA